MRLGLVCLLAAVFAAGEAAAQKLERLSSFTVPSDRTMLRPDGTPFEAGLPRRAIAPGAVSFRHYVHQPAKKAQQYFAKAIKAVKSSNGEEALSNLTEALRIDPEYFEAHAQLGVIYLENDRHEEALSHLERALAIDSSSQTVQALAACALLGLGKFAEAETAALRALQMGRSLPALVDVIRLARLKRTAISRRASSTVLRP